MEDNKRIKMICSVERIKYFKDDWGIIQVSVDKVQEGTVQTDKYNLVTLKGSMPKPKEGAQYNVIATLVNDERWGEQYEAISVYTSIEFGADDQAGQKQFLSSLFTPIQVNNMYKALDNPFEVLKRRDALQLVKVKGCGMRTANNWINKFHTSLHLGRIYTELEDYHLTNKMIERLMERYTSPDMIITKVKENPYILCTEVDGIGWKTADKIALDGGIDPYGVQRIGAFMRHYLNSRGSEGCSWVTPDELMGAILEELGEETPDEAITESIHDLEDVLWWNKDKSKIGLKKYYNVELAIAKELLRIRDAESYIAYKDWEDTVKHLEHKQGWQYTEEQKKGIQAALENNIVVIQGGAGTGKTTLVAAMLEILKHYKYVQCALSGRASSRMAEVTSQEGYTIHRLLGYPDTSESSRNMFTYHDGNPLGADIYIIDEISMIDAQLFYYLLRAIPDGAKVICLGDTGQLESIGSGNVAHDMIHSGEIPVISLTQIHRQAAASAIITESVKVRNGTQLITKDWVGTEIRGELRDLEIEAYSDITNTYYRIMESYAQASAVPNFNILETQIIVPIKNRGAACTYVINNAIQELYNPADKTKVEYTTISAGKPFVLREGDKVINTKNNYQTEPCIYNGSIGIVKSIDLEAEIMVVDFVSIGEVEIEKKYWNTIELAYAISIHKSQGSQWDHVILGLDFSAYSLLTRELVYTAITRAAKYCKIIAQTGALRFAVGNTSVSHKQTHLCECLYNEAHPKLIF